MGITNIFRGKTFTGSVLRDGLRLGMPKGTSSSAGSAAVYADEAAVKAATGVMEVGPGDAVMLVPFGTDANNEVSNIYVFGIYPVVDANGEVQCWHEVSLSILQATLCTQAVGAELAAALEGVDATDLFADEITFLSNGSLDTGGLDDQAHLVGQNNNNPVFAVIQAFGAPYIRTVENLTTAASLGCLYKRVANGAMPQAFPSKGGGA